MMDDKSLPANGDQRTDQEQNQTRYIPPTITTYSSEEILEQVGPVQACSPAPCGVFG